MRACPLTEVRYLARSLRAGRQKDRHWMREKDSRRQTFFQNCSMPAAINGYAIIIYMKFLIEWYTWFPMVPTGYHDTGRQRWETGRQRRLTWETEETYIWK